jgi:hypothetical protein
MDPGSQPPRKVKSDNNIAHTAEPSGTTNRQIPS